MKTIDLSGQFFEGMFKYPSDPEISYAVKKAVWDEEEIYDGGGHTSGMRVLNKVHAGNVTIGMRNHHGTHIDAPAHKYPEGKTIDQFPLEKFCNSCYLVDLRPRGVLSRDERVVEKIDLEEICGKEGLDLSKVGSALIYTGYCDELACATNKSVELGFPYLSTDVVSYLSGFKLNIVGIDSFSFDRRGGNSYAHLELLGKDILLLETVYGLNELSKALIGAGEKMFTLRCYPLNFKGADAAQTRAFAEVGENVISLRVGGQDGIT